jgi:hypothetical protein
VLPRNSVRRCRMMPTVAAPRCRARHARPAQREGVGDREWYFAAASGADATAAISARRPVARALNDVVCHPP